MANTFRRLSVAFKLGKNQRNSPTDSAPTLADFLSATKQEYLKAINETPSRGGEWTVVMGNEAGDLDTLASSIAYAWVESVVHKRRAVALIPIERDDLQLRAENIHALKLAGITKPQDQLLFLSDIPQLQNKTNPFFPSQRFVLVDHNKIKKRYTDNNPEYRVVAVVDHREDEGLYKETAQPRIVLPCGSCCSHITTSILPSSDKLPPNVSIPRELATLLLCGIMIDTDGLRPGGKALQLDRDATATLIPLSTYAQTITPSLLSTLSTGTKPNGNAVYDEKSMKELTAILSAKKTDLAHLSTRDLLRRDYKDEDYNVDWLPGNPTIRVGLSTIPVELKNWAREGTVENEILDWMKERGLHIHGAITSFKEKPNKKDKETSVKVKEKEKKGKARREQVWTVVDPSGFDNDPEAYSAKGKKVDVEKLAERLWSRLEADDSLRLRKHTQLELYKNGVLPKNVRVKVYHQTDPTPTRKYTMPLVKNILTQGESPPSPEETPNGKSSQVDGPTVKAKV